MPVNRLGPSGPLNGISFNDFLGVAKSAGNQVIADMAGVTVIAGLQVPVRVGGPNNVRAVGALGALAFSADAAATINLTVDLHRPDGTLFSTMAPAGGSPALTFGAAVVSQIAALCTQTTGVPLTEPDGVWTVRMTAAISAGNLTVFAGRSVLLGYSG